MVLVAQAAQRCHIAVIDNRLLVEHLQHSGIIFRLLISVKFTAKVIVKSARIDFIHEVGNMVFKCVYILELAIDAHFHAAFHAVAHVHQCLLLEHRAEHIYNGLPDFREHTVLIAMVMPCNSTHHPFEHKYVLDFGHVGHENLFLPQVFHLMIVAAVTVHDTMAVKVVKRLHVVKCPSHLYHLIAATHRLHGILRENERIELRVDAVHLVTLHKKHRLAAAKYVEVNLVGKSGI